MYNGDAASGEFTVHELVIRVKSSRRVPLRVPSGNRGTTTCTQYDNDGNRAGEYLESPRADCISRGTWVIFLNSRSTL